MVKKHKKLIAEIAFTLIQNVKILFQMPQGCCRFSPTCSEYAKEALEQKSFIKAIFAITKRVLKCHPLNAGGYDPVNNCHIIKKG
jgi:uncharacterized protein